MLYYPYLAKEHWPLDPLQNTVFQYFVYTRCCNNWGELINFSKRETLLNALHSNPEFAESWRIFQELHPAKTNYFWSLKQEGEPFDPSWVWNEYLQRKAFEGLSEEDKRTLQNEFDELRPSAYRTALEAEALRLNCDVTEVRPKSLILPWKPNHDEESMLVKLPTEIFARIFPLLDSLDIFRMTLVCQRLKSIVHENSMHLRKAEHAVTTHIITFTDWMDPQKTPNGRAFFNQYQVFSWCLAKWYCVVSENLETLILDHSLPYVYLATLLKSCPRLKRLQIADDRDRFIPTDGMIYRTVQLRQLEVFLCSNWHSPFSQGGIPRRHIQRDVLISSESLQVLRGALNMEDCSFIIARKPLSIVFSKLIALDLDRFTASAIEILAQVDDLQLRYLRFGFHEYRAEWDEGQVEERTRDALHLLLPKLARLEVLITSTNVGIKNDTIKLLTNLENDLWDPSVEIDPLEPEVLIAFQDMLLSKNPAIDLSNIHFVLVEGERLKSLEAVATGFSFQRMFDDSWEASLKTELYHPQMQRRLGVDF